MSRISTIACLISLLVVFTLPVSALAEEGKSQTKGAAVGDHLDELRELVSGGRSDETVRELLKRIERELPATEKTKDDLAKVRPITLDEAFEAQLKALTALRKVTADQKAVRAALTRIGTAPKALVAAKAALDQAEAVLGAKTKAAAACGKANCGVEIMRAVAAEVRAAAAAYAKAHDAHDAAWDDFVFSTLSKRLTGKPKDDLLSARRSMEKLEEAAEKAKGRFDENLRAFQALDPTDGRRQQMLPFVMQLARERDASERALSIARHDYRLARDTSMFMWFPEATVNGLVRADNALDALIHGTADQPGIQTSYERLSGEVSRLLPTR